MWRVMHVSTSFRISAGGMESSSTHSPPVHLAARLSLILTGRVGGSWRYLFLSDGGPGELHLDIEVITESTQHDSPAATPLGS